MSLFALLLSSSALASDFMDVWVSSAFEDDNVLAGPEAFSPAPNFVLRGNQTFFEQYESRASKDISQSDLVVYRRDDGFFENWWTEAAFVLRMVPFLNPDRTNPGVAITDDGSYVRIVRNLPGKKHYLSFTGFAVDASRWRLGYSFDLSWGARNIHAFRTGAAPGARIQWEKGGNYAFFGAKTAVGDYVDPDTRRVNNQAYYGLLAGAGIEIKEKLRVEAGAGSFEQGQILNVSDTTSPLYGEIIQAAGVSGQVAYRTNADLPFIQSADLRLYRNTPEYMRDTYISHRKLEGFGMIVQAEINALSHNLLSPTNEEETVIERALAGDVQAILVHNTTNVQVDLVYKDLSYILFNVPGLTSGVATPVDLETTPQLYGRASVYHYIEDAHFTPYIGGGLMQPATYTTADGTFVQYTERDKEQVPEGQEAAAILSTVGGFQVDVSKSTIFIGEVLYSVDNNQSEFIQTADNPEGVRVAAPQNERQRLGFNLIVRARF
jgi:hypothetical protein